MTSARGPASAFILGWAGVLPFAALSAAIWIGVPMPIQPTSLLLGYGATILSFMAGVQWGLTMLAPDDAGSRWRGYTVSVVPALVAWCCLFAPTGIGLVALALTFAALLAYDLWTLRRGYAPSWYGRLRCQLTCAVVCLLIASAIRVGYP